MAKIKSNTSIASWDKKKGYSSYKLARFSQNKSILIVCEGQTEKEYFGRFDVVLLNIECIDTKGLSKRQLVQFCKERVENYKSKGRKFNQVWCVFDMDVKRGENEFADYDNAIQSAHKQGYKVAYSNDSFELWFYLHFHYTDHQNLRTFYYKQLGAEWGINYEKNGKEKEFCQRIYGLLNKGQEDAIKHAAKLHNDRKHLPFSQQNPTTTVYELVNELKKYLRGTKHS